MVDISRDILELSEVVYPDPAENPLRDPRVRVHVEDGRYFLETTPQRYDLITGEPPPPKNAGVVNLYTREYFAADARPAGARAASPPSGCRCTTCSSPTPRRSCAPSATSSTTARCGSATISTGCSRARGGTLPRLRGGLRRRSGATPGWRPSSRRGPRAGRSARRHLPGRRRLAARAGARHQPLTDNWPKRLSDRLQGDARGSFGPWMDAAAARERFRESAWVRRVWPASLRQRTLDSFDVQRVIDEIARGEPLGWPRRLAELPTRCSPFRRIRRSRSGGSASPRTAGGGRARRAAGHPLAPHVRALAVQALVEGRLQRAARAFARARRVDPADPGLLLLGGLRRARARGSRDGAARAGPRATRRRRGARERALAGGTPSAWPQGPAGPSDERDRRSAPEVGSAP